MIDPYHPRFVAGAIVVSVALAVWSWWAFFRAMRQVRDDAGRRE